MSWLNLKRGWIYMLSFLERLSKFNAMYFREFRRYLFLSIKALFAYLGSGKHFSVRHRRYKFKCMVCNCNLCDMNRPIFVPSKYLPVEGTFESSMFICWIWLSIVFLSEWAISSQIFLFSLLKWKHYGVCLACWDVNGISWNFPFIFIFSLETQNI